MPERHLSASKRKQQVSDLLLYISKFFCFLRDTAVSAFDSFCLSVFVRRSLGRIFAVAQMRTTAKHGFAAYSLEDSLQKENSRFETCYTFLNFFGFCEIRPFPPLILLGLSMFARRSLGRIFAVAQMRTTAKPCFAAYSLEDSLQTKKEQARPVLFLFVKGFQKRYPLVFINRSELIRSRLI